MHLNAIAYHKFGSLEVLWGPKKNFPFSYYHKEISQKLVVRMEMRSGGRVRLSSVLRKVLHHLFVSHGPWETLVPCRGT